MHKVTHVNIDRLKSCAVEGGSHFDLPIALALLVALQILPADAVEDIVALGELSLDATLVPVIGALPAAAAGQIDSEAAADVASDVGTDLRDSTQSVMQDYLAIRPVIHVDQGTRITVMVDRDLEIF